MGTAAKHGLPVPEPSLSAQERGALLLRYVTAGAPVAIRAQGTWERLDFRGADLRGADLRNALLEGVRLVGADLREATLEGAILRNGRLQGAQLRGADLRGADVSDADLRRVSASNTRWHGAYMRRARLEQLSASDAVFDRANLREANLLRAHLRNASFVGADLRAAKMRDAWGQPGERRGCLIDARTYEKSGWDPFALFDWVRAGAIVHDSEKLPDVARALVQPRPDGLSLTFNTRLNRVDRFVIEGVIVAVLGRDTSCEISEFVVRENTGQTLVRLTADSPDQLLAVALVLTDIVGDADTDGQRGQLDVWGKRYFGDEVKTQWKSTVGALSSVELRIEETKLEALQAASPAYAAFRGFTAFEPTTWRRVAGEMLRPLWAALLDAADKGAIYTIMKGAEPLVFGPPAEVPPVQPDAKGVKR